MMPTPSPDSAPNALTEDAVLDLLAELTHDESSERVSIYSAANWGFAIGVYLGIHHPEIAMRLKTAQLRMWSQALNEISVEIRERRVQQKAEAFIAGLDTDLT